MNCPDKQPPLGPANPQPSQYPNKDAIKFYISQNILFNDRETLPHAHKIICKYPINTLDYSTGAG